MQTHIRNKIQVGREIILNDFDAYAYCPHPFSPICSLQQYNTSKKVKEQVGVATPSHPRATDAVDIDYAVTTEDCWNGAKKGSTWGQFTRSVFSFSPNQSLAGK